MFAVLLKVRPYEKWCRRLHEPFSFFLLFFFLLSSSSLLIHGRICTTIMVLHMHFIAARALAQHLLTPFIVGTLSLLKRLRAGTLSKYTCIRRRKCERYRYALILSPFVRSSLTLSPRRGTVHLPVLYECTHVSRLNSI